MKIIGITGGTGFIGRHVSQKLLDAGHQVIVFSRGGKEAKGRLLYAHWDPAEKQIDTAALTEIDGIIHLAGAGVVDKRWTAAYKKELIDSRVAATDFLVTQLKQHSNRCKSFVAASAIGYYGPDQRNGAFRETDPPYQDFLAKLCVDWEAASMKASPQFRTSIFRFGIVLGAESGAYPQLAAPLKMGIVPILGSGNQVMSWIHVEDIAGMIMSASLDEGYKGVFNAVAPEPATNTTIMKTIAAIKGGRKLGIRVPAMILKVIMGESSSEVLKSCTVSSDKVQHQGYQFQYPELKMALEAVERAVLDEKRK